MGESVKPVVLLAFANDRVDGARYLRNLPEELRDVAEALEPASDAGHCDVVKLPNATVDDICDALQKYRDRIAIFHYGGHAGGTEIVLETARGGASVAHAGGLAELLGAQRGLQLVFLNGCSSRRQVAGLIDAGVPAVIATSQAIDDGVATEFSARFYKGLASGGSVPTAYNEAHAEALTRFGETPRSAYRDIVSEPVVDDRWPWDLIVAEGSRDYVESWSLALATRDPYFGLPPLPKSDLPSSPFKHLEWFTRRDAEVFFGRGKEIRRLYKAATLPDSAPVVLLYGAAGAGKSSLLDAGLHPRLEASHEVVYLRRDAKRGLLGTLNAALEGGEADLGAAWARREQRAGRPLVIVLDQVEEAFTRPNPARPHELADLAAALRPAFAVPENRPAGRLFLSFRKEWLAEVQDLLNNEQVPFRRILMKHLDRDGIMEAVCGLRSNSRLRDQYRLEVDDELPGIIADDLLEDRDAAMAPALQVLLTKMWVQATKKDPDAPQFTVEHYQTLKRQGILLDDFLDEQLRALRTWRADVVDSGLALDLLAHHTTPVGTAETRLADEVLQRYADRQQIIGLVRKCKDLYLLGGSARVTEDQLLAEIDDEGNRGNTRLAHDTLAPLVRRRFQASDLPGQRALRVLLGRGVDWVDGKDGVPLDASDLGLVEVGEAGMRSRTPDEERMVAASRERRASKRRQARLRKGLAAAAVLVIASLGVFAAHQWRQSERNAADLGEALEQTQLQEARRLLDDGQPRAALARLAGALRLGSSRARVRAVDLLLRLQATIPSEQLAHDSALRAASFSPDGAMMATASADGVVRVWDAASGARRYELLHGAGVNDLSFSADGELLITASADGTAKIWDAGSGASRGVLPHDAGVGVNAAAFRPDDDRVVATGSVDGVTRLWDWQRGELLRELPSEGNVVNAVAFSFATAGSESRHVAAAMESGIALIWDLSSDATEPITTLRHDDGRPIKSIVFHPGDPRFLVTGSLDTTAQVWDARTGERQGSTLRHRGPVLAATFSPDGRQVVTGSGDGRARVWTWHDAGLVKTLRPQGASAINAVSVSPDGTRVITAAGGRWEQEGSSARVWDIGIGSHASRSLQHDSIRDANFSPDGSLVVTASDVDSTARIWDLTADPPAPVATLPHQRNVTSASFSADGTAVVTSTEDGSAWVWDARTGEKTSEQALKHPFGNAIYSAVFSPDSRWIITASEDGMAQLWDWRAQNRLRILGHQTNESINSAQFDPSGQWVVTAGEDGQAQVWEALTGNEVGSPIDHGAEIFFAAFSPDGRRLVTAGANMMAGVWDWGERRLIGSPLRHAAAVVSARFSPDGSSVVTASGDGTVRIWDAETGDPLGEPLVHDDWVFSAAFSPDGLRVVTASGDHARVWHVDVPFDSDADREHLAALAELVADHRFNERGHIEDLSAAEQEERLALLGFHLTETGEIQPSNSGPAAGVGEYILALGRWCLSRPADRPESPFLSEGG